METAILPPNTIVPEVLERNNYERWSILMQHYLVAQDVWDVVMSSPTLEETNTKGWIKKNALALHAIKISCGAKAFDRIKRIDLAKDAWKKLLDMVELPVSNHDIEEVVSSDITEQQSALREIIFNGNKRRLKRFFDDNPNARYDEGILKFALHVAITTGKGDMARYLYRMTLLEFLGGDHVHPFILLEECITKKMFEIAFDLLKHFPELVTKYPPLGYTPIILTLAKTPAPFYRGSQLKFLRLWLYRCIEVNIDLIKPRVPADDASWCQSCHQFLGERLCRPVSLPESRRCKQ